MRLIHFIFITILLSSCKSNDNNLENNEQSLEKLLTIKHSYIKIPMKQLKSGHLSITAKVNDSKGRFILDTGSSSTIIDKRYRKKFRLITKNTKKIAKTAGGTQLKMTVSYNNILEFGSLKLRNAKISLVNLSHINYSFQQMGMLQLDGIIGSDILKNRKAIIDYDNLVIYLKKG